MNNNIGFTDITQNKAMVRELQDLLYYIALYEQNIPLIYPDGIYGARTTAAVKAFQKEHCMTITGIADYETWMRIMECYNTLQAQNKEHALLTVIPNRDYEGKPGETSGTVRIIQTVLETLNVHNRFYEGQIVMDGVYGKNTEAAVCSFQMYSELPITGITDKATWDRMALIYRHIALRDE